MATSKRTSIEVGRLRRYHRQPVWPDALEPPRWEFVLGIISAMDLSGQTLLARFFVAPRRHVRRVICEDFVRVGDTMRTAAEVGSSGTIRISVPDFDWPDRDTYRLREERLRKERAKRHEELGSTRPGMEDDPQLVVAPYNHESPRAAR